MRKMIVFVLLLCGVFSLSADENNWIPCEKTYVSLDSLFIHREGIFVRLGMNWVQAPMIRHDINGLYIDFVIPSNRWVCDLCTANNPPWEKWCLTNGCPGFRPW